LTAHIAPAPSFRYLTQPLKGHAMDAETTIQSEADSHITTVGETAREASSLMKEFVRAARIQLHMEATGAELLGIPAEVCERVATQYKKHDRGRASAEWPAYLRQLDAIDPGYRA
jgi:hypothetical protein